MVNKGQIHRKLGKILMISSNLIKSDNKSVIEMGEMIFYERGLEGESNE